MSFFPKMFRAFGVLILGATAGCTTYEINPVAANEHIQTIFIHENPKVKDAALLDVIEDGFSRHGIRTQIVPQYAAVPPNSYSATYVGYRGWDFVPYLKDATVNIRKNGLRIASANFHLFGAGGLDFSKFNSTREKIAPMMDELLANVSRSRDRQFQAPAKTSPPRYPH